jgi:hypothetical protein
MIVKGEKVELYNLADDIGERENLIDQHPKRTATMHKAIIDWKANVTWEREESAP